MSTNRTRRQIAVWMAMFVIGWGVEARAQSPWRGVKSQNFAVLAMADEFDSGRVTIEELQSTANWFENIYSIFVEKLKVLPPAGPIAKSGQIANPRVLVFVYDWTRAGPYKNDETARTEALAFHRLGTIHLKIADLRSRDVEMHVRRMVVITHELFHAVQIAYDPSTRFKWMREATAQWAVWLATMTDDTDDVHVREMGFLDNTGLPLGYMETLSTNPEPGVSVGHPYGTSILFRFLSEHHGGSDLLKKYMEAWRDSRERDMSSLGPTAGYHPLGLAAQVLGTKGPDDPAFRTIYDRFTAACALGPDAPNYPLADVARFTRGADRVNSGWDVHYLDDARTPADVVFPVPHMKSVSVIARDTPAFELRGKQLLSVGNTEIGTGGFVCLSIARPHGLPPNSILRVEVVAEPGEISVQGLIRRRLDQPVELVAGRYVDDRRAYVLEIPKFETASDLDVKSSRPAVAQWPIAHPFQPGLNEVVVVLTRYTLGPEIETESALEAVDGSIDSVANALFGAPASLANPPRENVRPYPVFISVATPPTVARLTLTQQRKPVYDVRWVDHVNESGVLDSRTREIAAGDDLPLPAESSADAVDVPRARSSARLEPALGDAEIEVWFSLPIAESTPPQLSINGNAISLTPNAEADRWRGTIPASLFSTGEQKFQIRASAAPRGTNLNLPLDEDSLTVAAVMSHVDLLDPTAPRNTEWARYERSDAGMSVMLGLKRPKREARYSGLVRDGTRLYKPGDVTGDSRKVLESSAFVSIELDTGTVGGNITFNKERNPQGSSTGKAPVDRLKADLFSHVSYNWAVPESARGEVIVQGDARFEAVDEEGPNVWVENFSLVLYRGDDLAISGYPEYQKHFLVLFKGKPDRATLDQVLKSERDALPADVRAVLLPIND